MKCPTISVFWKSAASTNGVSRATVSRSASSRQVITGLDTPTDEDVRRTLYWNPNVKSDAQGKASAVFFSNSREKQCLRISVRVVTADGRFVDFEH